MIKFIMRKLQRALVNQQNKALVRGRTKYFCIGQNKTGTTSLKKAFEDLGFIVGDQSIAERLADRYYFESDFEPIISYCKTAQVFQDIPFSWPETFNRLDLAYPGSKFILSVRDSADQWYQSVTRFHAKSFGRGNIPTANELKNATYVSKGFIYRAMKVYGTSDDDIYNKDILIAYYNKYNESVLSYFKDRPEDLLVINLSSPDAYQRYCAFINMESSRDGFPWENKT